MWSGEPHPFPERGSPTRLSTSGNQVNKGDRVYCVLILLILKIKVLRDVMPHLTVNNYGIFIRRVKQRRLKPADELWLPHTPACNALRQRYLFLPVHYLGTINILSLHRLCKLPAPGGRAGGVRDPSDSEVSRKFLCEKCNFCHYLFPFQFLFSSSFHLQAWRVCKRYRITDTLPWDSVGTCSKGNRAY